MSTIFMYLIALVASYSEEPHYSMLKSYYLWRIIMGGKITVDHIFVTADTLRKLHLHFKYIYFISNQTQKNDTDDWKMLDIGFY